jgi:hypothetical protein
MEDSERERFLAAVREGLADAEAGRVVDDEELDSFLDEQFGPLARFPWERWRPRRHVRRNRRNAGNCFRPARRPGLRPQGKRTALLVLSYQQARRDRKPLCPESLGTGSKLQKV